MHQSTKSLIAGLAHVLVLYVLATGMGRAANFLESVKLFGDVGQQDGFGRAVAMDGDTLMISEPMDDDLGTDAGSVYVFNRDPSGQWVFSQKLFTSETQRFLTRFGWGLALDGDSAVITNGANESLVYAFARGSDGSWTQEQILLDPQQGLSVPRYVVDISRDTIVVGDITDDETRADGGAAFVFRKQAEGGWVQEAKLLGDAGDACCTPEFGVSVAISGDTIVVGARNEHTGQANTGAAYVFVRGAGGNWTRQAKLVAADGAAADWFGSAVKIDGETAVIGAGNEDTACPQDPSNCNSGAAYVFDRDAGDSWSQTIKLVPSDTAERDGFGNVLALSGPLLIGGSSNDAAGLNAGAAYVFVRNSRGSWTQHQKLVADDTVALQGFSSSTAISRSQLLIGAVGDDTQALDSGAAYVFDVADPLLMRRSTDQRWFMYQLSGSTVVNKGFMPLTRSAAYSVVSRSDFDGDGEADLLLRDLSPSRDENGRWVLYTFAGNTVTSQGFMDAGLTRNANWQVVSSEDFDGDAEADLLLRNAVDGRWLLYLLDSHAIKSQAVMPMSTDLTDTLQGVGDFNGDGRADVLLRRADGSWLVYLLDGLTAPVQGAPAMTANLGFSVQSLGDFNGDGKSDVLMRRADGRWFMYLVNGIAISSSGSPVLTEAPDFQLSNIADFNGDGKSDVLVRRQTDGRWFLYTMNGVAVLDGGAPDMTRNLAFHVMSTQDFTSDGNADVLLRRDDGRWVLYEMNGPLVSSKGIPDMTRNTSFEVYVP